MAELASPISVPQPFSSQVPFCLFVWGFFWLLGFLFVFVFCFCVCFCFGLVLRFSQFFILLSVLGTFFAVMIKIPRQKQHRGERICFGSEFDSIVHHDEEGLAVELEVAAWPIAPAGKNRAAAHCCPLRTLLTHCRTPAHGPDNQEGSLISMPRG